MPFPKNPNFTATPAVETRIDNTKYIVIDDLPDETEDEINELNENRVVLNKKRKLFLSMRKNKPVLLDLLTDSFAESMRDNFNATFSITEKTYNELLNK